MGLPSALSLGHYLVTLDYAIAATGCILHAHARRLAPRANIAPPITTEQIPTTNKMTPTVFTLKPVVVTVTVSVQGVGARSAR
jgi:hypothetical protein